MKFNFIKHSDDANKTSLRRVTFTHMESIFNYFPLPISITRVSDGKFIYGNDGLLKMFGVDKKRLLGNTSVTLGVWHKEEIRRDFVAALYDGAHIRFVSLSTANNRRFDIYATVVESNHEELCVSCLCDTTDEFNYTNDAKNVKAHFQELVAALNEAYFVCDMQGRFKSANAACCMMLGYSERELLEMSIDALLPVKTSERDKQALHAQLIDFGVTDTILQEWNKRGGDVIHVETKRFLIRDEHGVPTGFWSIAVNASDRVLKHKQEIYPMYHDQTTELPNRAWLADRLQRMISRARISSENIVLLYVDIAGFARIKNEYGTRIGDLAVKEVARQIENALRSIDVMARVGPGEFAIVLGADPGDKCAMSLLRRLIRLFSRQFEIGDAMMKLSLNVGVSVFPKDAFDDDSLLREAESAMRKAAALIEPNASVKFSFSSQELDVWAHKRSTMEDLFLDSFSTDALFVRYQPIMALNENEMTFAAVEALVRWRHPEFGELGPGSFLEMADELGVSAEVDRKIVEMVLSDLEKWLATGWNKRIAINLSRQTLEDPSFPKWAAGEAAARNIKTSLIGFDVNSALILERNRVIRSDILKLRDEGFAVNADGFDSEISLITELTNMGIGEMKIAPHDLKMISENKYAVKLLQLINERLKIMGINLTISGIENEADDRLSHETDASFLAGFYYAEPLISVDIANFKGKYNEL